MLSVTFPRSSSAVAPLVKVLDRHKTSEMTMGREGLKGQEHTITTCQSRSGAELDRFPAGLSIHKLGRVVALRVPERMSRLEVEELLNSILLKFFLVLQMMEHMRLSSIGTSYIISLRPLHFDL